MKEETPFGEKIACYDNGGKSFDRITVVFLERKERRGLYECLGMSEDARGFCEHSSAARGRHLGKRVAFASLSKGCQAAVKNEKGTY